MAIGDVIDLSGRAANGIVYSHKVLRVTADGATVARLKLESHFTTADFALAPDGSGGTDITLLGGAAGPLAPDGSGGTDITLLGGAAGRQQPGYQFGYGVPQHAITYRIAGPPDILTGKG